MRCKTLSSEQIYQDEWTEIQKEFVEWEDGRREPYAVMIKPAGVTVVARKDPQTLVLVSEYKHILKRYSLECISGGIQSGETPEQAAHRELIEETGYESHSMKRLGVVHPFTSSVVSESHLFLAEDLFLRGGFSPSPTEPVIPVDVPIELVREKIRSGKIVHAPSCVALLLYLSERSD